MQQEHYFYLFLALSGLAACVFAWVARSTREPRELTYEAAGRLRAKWFYCLCAVLPVCLAITLPLMPYAKSGARPDQVVYVVAKQFAFLISAEPIPIEKTSDEDFMVSAPKVAAGSLVEFEVSSADVTHGFSLYDGKGRLITQTQAMPGYVNRLQARLPEPGTYAVLCMELCGMAHHAMRGALTVGPAKPNTPLP